MGWQQFFLRLPPLKSQASILPLPISLGGMVSEEVFNGSGSPWLLPSDLTMNWKGLFLFYISGIFKSMFLKNSDFCFNA